MTSRDGTRSSAEIAVEFAQHVASESGEDYLLKPVRLWVRGVDGDSSMTADEVAVFADVIGG